MRRYLPFIIVTAVGLLTIGSGAMLYRAKRLSMRTAPKNYIVSGLPGGEPMHVRGRLDAPVTLEEFGDLQCPPCGTLAGAIDQLLRDYQPRLRLIFRHFPLVTHQRAREAAFASEAAGLQGRFWEMHDLLYRGQSIWSNAADVRLSFNTYAGILGLDIDRFKKDMGSEQVRQRVAADRQRGASLGVTRTPTVFINNHALPAASVTPAGLRAAIDAAMKAPLP
ncbi:MAG: thioredoxin domain-containing protein [Verrucomicrobiota bacterium]